MDAADRADARLHRSAAPSRPPAARSQGGSAVLRRLLDRLRRRPDDDRPAAAPADRDYAQEREERRLAQMSEEDRAWGAASQQRDRDTRERDQPPPVE